MGRQERLKLLQNISRQRKAGLLCYITGDWENVSTRIAPDVTPVIFRHLEMLGEQPRIDLFLYTRGGDILTPWRLIQLLREYTGELGVLVPYRAYSAGTLLCLGADELLMGKMAELGPIDPSVVNAFNPQDPLNARARVPVNVEDVYSYLSLAREKAGLTGGADLAGAFTLLAERIHPLALGNVHRNYLLIRSLARKLLQLRRNPPAEEAAEAIVNHLTEKFYAHNYMITRREAAGDIGLPVIYPGPGLEKDMWQLYEDYARELSLDEPFSPDGALREGRDSFEVVGGMVESIYGQDGFVFSGNVERMDLSGKRQLNVHITRQGWKSFV